ncbi:MAG: oxidoreductase [Candidatus Hydrogenedentota bacterium]
MKTHTVGVIMNGVTGRMSCNQHLIRSILAIRSQGGVRMSESETIMPDPVLVGRNEAKLSALSAAHGDLNYTTDVSGVLNDAHYPVYFDALATNLRYDMTKLAIAAGKHVYCEKPVASTSAEAMELYTLAKSAGIKHGVVQDKLWLPGLLKLKYLIDTGYFGRILSVRGEFGYWVFTGEHQPAQRPSWNYRQADGGGIVLDMLCHWRYVIDNLFGNVKNLTCHTATHIPHRWDEKHQKYVCDTDDSCYATFITDRDIVCHFNSSWCVRVRRDDLLTLQVDGTNGSAVAGLRHCWIQPDAATPRPVWNPDIDSPLDYFAAWEKMPPNAAYDNAFKAQWELFLKHVVKDTPFPWDLKEAAKGVQLAELGYASARDRKWVDVPGL